MENTTKIVETMTRKKGSEKLLEMLPKSYVRRLSEITGFSETKIANELRGKRWGDAEMIDVSQRIADMNVEFGEKVEELLKPFKNAKFNKNRN